MRTKAENILEYQQRLCVKLLDEGLKQCKVAEILEKTQGWVSQVFTKYKKFGFDGLKEKKAKGADCRLTTGQRIELRKIINNGAEVYGFEGDVWTRKRLRVVINEQFKIGYSERHVERIVKSMGFTIQKPKKIDYRQDPKKIKDWKENELPKIKKKAEEEDRVIMYADEAGIGLLPSLHSTYAERGVTPILKEACKYSHVSIACAISTQGQLIYQLQKNSFDGDAIVLFLKKICEDVKEKILLIWDGAKIHFSKAVKEYLETIKDNKLWLVRQPPYSPELNASEYVWHYIKDVDLKNMCFQNITELSKKTISLMDEFKEREELIKSFFKNPKVGFINN